MCLQEQRDRRADGDRGRQTETYRYRHRQIERHRQIDRHILIYTDGQRNIVIQTRTRYTVAMQTVYTKNETVVVPAAVRVFPAGKGHKVILF